MLCRVMEVSRSGYYRFIERPAREADARLVQVKAIAQVSRYSYGSRRMAKALQAQGYSIGRYAARSLMRQAGIACKQRRRYRRTTQSQHTLAVASNILNRRFTAAAPNQVWTTDITYLWTEEGWLYIAAVLDMFSRRVVGWAMASHLRETLVHQALQMALGRRRPKPGLLHHSDRGIQYASRAYVAACKTAGITMSMSRVGNCWDNAVMERCWGSLKSECTQGKRYLTRAIAKADVVDYFEMFYNSKRLHSSLGYVSPLHFEHQFLLQNMSTSS